MNFDSFRLEAPMRANGVRYWKVSHDGPFLHELEPAVMLRHAKNKKQKPALLDITCMGERLAHKFFLIEIGESDWLCDLATGQLYNPQTGACRSSVDLHICQIEEAV